MSNTPSLLPCPFCGGINIIHCGHHMYCHACGADGPDADSQHESEAIAAWNRRTPQPVVREPLTDEQLYEEKHNAVPKLFDLARDWADNKIHSYQFAHEAERIVNVVARRVEAAHGITQNGGSNAE